jgi:hypothetical protein
MDHSSFIILLLLITLLNESAQRDLIIMKRVIHAPVEIPQLKEYRSVDGHRMCYLSGWKIIGMRLYITLSNEIGGKCKIDLEEEAPKMGFGLVAGVVQAPLYICNDMRSRQDPKDTSYGFPSMQGLSQRSFRPHICQMDRRGKHIFLSPSPMFLPFPVQPRRSHLSQC